MIVQTAAEGQPHFVIFQTDHAQMSGQIARAFGNDSFAALRPRDLMEFIITHHDEGWIEIDQQTRYNPQTRLPYHLTQTPTDQLLATGPKSPDFNEAHHPYCGLISSMHTWGLYHGRYGLSDKIYIDSIDPSLRPQVEAMLQNELDRQGRIKAELKQDSQVADWVADEMLFHNYKLLQFCDTLALYFQTIHAGAHAAAQFKHVPMSIGKDATVSIEPLGDNRYLLSPYPFAESVFEIHTTGRYVHPMDEQPENLAAYLKTLPVEIQRFTLMAG